METSFIVSGNTKTILCYIVMWPKWLGSTQEGMFKIELFEHQKNHLYLTLTVCGILETMYGIYYSKNVTVMLSSNIYIYSFPSKSN